MNTRIVLAAVAALSAANVFACTGFVAGKRATATGRVIVSHNEGMPYEVSDHFRQ